MNSPILDYIAEHCLTDERGCTTWAGATHPRYKWACIPEDITRQSKPLRAAYYLYSYWRMPDHYLDFFDPTCGRRHCLLPEHQNVRDTPMRSRG